ncbi:MAG: AsmA family protein [Gammaproteobacteria bacterium]|nr:AsmA family protein [Gammaproteobacteria bacterium]
MKLFRRVLTIVFFLLVIVVAGVGILLATFDPNSYKGQIEQLVKDETGRDLSLQGDISLSIFPKIGLDLGRVELGNAKGFGEAAFAEVNQVTLNVALLPLLKQQVEIDTIVLDGLSLNLQRNNQGISNWDDLAGAGEEKPAEEEKPEVKESGSGGAPAIDLKVQGLQITNAKLIYVDETTDQSLSLDPFNLRAGSLAYGQPMPLEMDLHLVQKPDTDLVATLTAMLTIDPPQQKYALSDLKLESRIKQPDLPNGELSVKLAADASADLNTQTATLEKLAIDVLGLRLDGRMDVAELDATPAFKGKFAVREFSPRDLLRNLGGEAPETADPKVLSKTSLSFNLSGTPEQVALTGLKAILDDSTMTGEARASSLDKDIPVIRVNLSLDGIDLDRYAAPDKPEGVTGASGTASDKPVAASDELNIPKEMLRQQDAILDFKLGKLIVQKATLTDAQVRVAAQRGVVVVEPFKASLYEGAFSAMLKMDVRTDTPKFTITEKLTGVRSGPLLKDMFGDNYLSGKANSNISLTTSGNQVSSLKKNLNGKLSIAFGEGSVNDSELADKINKAIAAIEQRPFDPNKKSTNFSKLTATAKVSNGVIDNRDLHLLASKFQIKGLGTANLVSEQVDYQLRMMRPGQDPNKQKIYAPINIKGSFDSMNYDFDEKAYLKQLADREVKKVEEKAKKKIDEELNKALEGLFKR